MASLSRRPRRLRATPALRALVRETALRADDLILPLFVNERLSKPQPVASMPGVSQWPLEGVVRQAVAAADAGLRSILLFGLPSKKDARATAAYAEDGIVQRAVAAIRKELPHMVVATDVCLCEYMSHGHCGLVDEPTGEVLNDETLELLARTAVSHAAAGASVVAPSDMMDGRIRAIRDALDAAGLHHTVIMSYAAKFASAFYGPFREAAASTPQFGDRRSYQMDCANAMEALREVEMDVAESADIVIVKPGLSCLDLVWRVKDRFGMPTAVYNVSGEYAMVKAAAQNGWLDERGVVMETMTAFKRAGADLIITYWAQDAVRWLREEG